MSLSGLDFTITIPKQHSFTPPSSLTLNPTVQLQTKDSISRLKQSDSDETNCFSALLSAIASFFKGVWDFFFSKTEQPVSTTPPISIPPISTGLPSPQTTTWPEDATERQRALTTWQQKMTANLYSRQGFRDAFVDLSGRTNEVGTCNAIQMSRIPHIGHYHDNYPTLTDLVKVKLPRRQLDQFPEAIRSQLSAYDADHLDLYFIVWRDCSQTLENADQRGKRNLIFHPIAFPNAQNGETHYQNLSMGIFEPEGIQVAQGDPNAAMPINQFGLQNVHIHPRNDPIGQVMCMSPDQSRFYLPPGRPYSSFFSACKLPNNRATAFFGVIINPSLRSSENNVFTQPLYRDHITLQEYKTGIQNSHVDANTKAKINRMLSFH